MKGILLVSVLFFVLVSGVSANPEIYQRLDTSSYQLFVRNLSSLEAICSAAAYWTNGKTTRLLTAGHCVVDESVRYALTNDGLNFREANILLRGWKAGSGMRFSWRSLLKGLPNLRAISTYNGMDVSLGDWAILEVKGKFETIPIGDSKILKMGDELFAIGYPIGGDKMATRGIVGNPAYLAPGFPWDGYIGANIPALPGNSGTAIVNTKGEMVAILVAGVGDNLHLLTPISLVRERAKCLSDEICPESKP